MTRKTKSPTAALVRSSAAEYLTFVAASGAGGVEATWSTSAARPGLVVSYSKISDN